MNAELNRAPQAALRLIQLYYVDNDWEGAMAYFDPEESTWIGLSEGAHAYRYEEIRAFFEQGSRRSATYVLADPDFRLVASGEDFAVVMGRVRVELEQPGEAASACEQRMSFVFRLRGGALALTHLHVSMAGRAPGQGDSLPDAVSRASYERIVRALKEKSAQVEMIVRTTAGGMKGSLDDAQYTFFYVNDELCSMLGYTREEFLAMSGGTAVGAVYPPDLPRALADCARCFAQGPEYQTEYRIRKKDGGLLWVMDKGRKVVNDRGETVINSLIVDISEMKRATEQLEMEQRRYEIVAELSEDVIFDYDAQSDLLLRFTRVSDGMPRKKLMVPDFRARQLDQLTLTKEDAARIHSQMEALARTGGQELIDLEFQAIGHPDRWFRALGKCLYDADGHLARVVGKVADITEQRQLQLRSVTDSLTGAFNRGHMAQLVDGYLAAKPPESMGAFIMFDLDHFKRVNDRLGHLRGDGALVGFVELLRSFFLHALGVARLGGDEFMVFLRDVYSASLVEELLVEFWQALAGYARAHRLEGSLSVSAGAALTLSEGDRFEDLYARADIALYTAKRAGRSQWALYRPGMTYPAVDG